MTAQPKCPDCGGKMSAGWLADRGESHATTVAAWVAGEPEEAKLFGLGLGLPTTHGKPKIPVAAYRCDRCGLVKLYALEPAE